MNLGGKRGKMSEEGKVRLILGRRWVGGKLSISGRTLRLHWTRGNLHFQCWDIQRGRFQYGIVSFPSGSTQYRSYSCAYSYSNNIWWYSIRSYLQSNKEIILVLSITYTHTSYWTLSTKSLVYNTVLWSGSIWHSAFRRTHLAPTGNSPDRASPAVGVHPSS